MAQTVQRYCIYPTATELRGLQLGARCQIVREPSALQCVAAGMPADENMDPRAVAAALDELVEKAYAILACCDAPGGFTERQTINHLLRLFESGDGFEARTKAEQLLRPN